MDVTLKVNFGPSHRPGRINIKPIAAIGIKEKVYQGSWSRFPNNMAGHMTFNVKYLDLFEPIPLGTIPVGVKTKGTFLIILPSNGKLGKSLRDPDTLFYFAGFNANSRPFSTDYFNFASQLVEKKEIGNIIHPIFPKKVISLSVRQYGKIQSS